MKAKKITVYVQGNPKLCSAEEKYKVSVELVEIGRKVDNGIMSGGIRLTGVSSLLLCYYSVTIEADQRLR